MIAALVSVEQSSMMINSKSASVCCKILGYPYMFFCIVNGHQDRRLRHAAPGDAAILGVTEETDAGVAI